MKQSTAILGLSVTLLTACTVEPDDPSESDTETATIEQPFTEFTCVDATANHLQSTPNMLKDCNGAYRAWTFGTSTSGTGYGSGSCSSAYIADFTTDVLAENRLSATSPGTLPSTLVGCTSTQLKLRAYAYAGTFWSSVPTVTVTGLWNGSSCSLGTAALTVPSLVSGNPVTKVRAVAQAYSGSVTTNNRAVNIGWLTSNCPSDIL